MAGSKEMGLLSDSPTICSETENYAIVFKPPRMHCAPLRQDENKSVDETLLDWYARIFPPVMELSGKKKGEGGLLHRLDFETQGLVLFAKNRESLENLLNQQEQGTFIKEYSAICQKTASRSGNAEGVSDVPPLIESYFRPYGPGRKQVRPVTEEKLKGREIAKDKNNYYKTEIIGVEKKQPCSDSQEELYHFTIRLRRGFRHQIRSHLAWIGFPVLNDPLYGKGGGGFLALRATGLFFADPKSGDPVEFCVERLEAGNN